MIIARRKLFLATFIALLISTYLVICLRSSSDRLYAGKSVSFWCDRLPYTDMIDGSFARKYRSATNPAEQDSLRDMEKQALLAITTLGTNCLPELLGRLRAVNSPLQFETKLAAAKLGLMKQTEVRNWHMRRMSALTGIVELGPAARDLVPELASLTDDADPWLSAAAGYALKQISPHQATNVHNGGPVGRIQ